MRHVYGLNTRPIARCRIGNAHHTICESSLDLLYDPQWQINMTKQKSRPFPINNAHIRARSIHTDVENHFCIRGWDFLRDNLHIDLHISHSDSAAFDSCGRVSRVVLISLLLRSTVTGELFESCWFRSCSDFQKQKFQNFLRAWGLFRGARESVFRVTRKMALFFDLNFDGRAASTEGLHYKSHSRSHTHSHGLQREKHENNTYFPPFPKGGTLPKLEICIWCHAPMLAQRNYACELCSSSPSLLAPL